MLELSEFESKIAQERLSRDVADREKEDNFTKQKKILQDELSLEKEKSILNST